MLGLVAGLFTAWVERKLIGAEGAAFDLTIVERCLLAGRAIWFYLGKLFWPTELIFIYPRWQVSQAVWWQYLFPAAALLLLAGLWVSAAAVACTAGGSALLRRNALPGAGVLQRVSVPLLLRGRSFPVLGEPGGDYAGLGRCGTLLARWGLWRRPAGYVAVPGVVGDVWRL